MMNLCFCVDECTTTVKKTVSIICVVYVGSVSWLW